MRLIALLLSGSLVFAGSVSAAAPGLAGPLRDSESACDSDDDEGQQVDPSDTVNDPVVTGPTSGGIRTGQPYGTTMVPLEDGWVEEEFFIEGTARTYTATTPQESAYKSRILVRRPTDPADFNGTVILDWNNVTVPADRDVAWSPLHEVIMERGYMYVSVAAQRLGVEASPLGLKQWDPVRYGS